MPFNGTGTFSQLYNWNTEAASPPIEIAKLQSQDDDMAGGLSNCITRDGQGKPIAAQDWNNQNLTNVNNLGVNGTATLAAISIPSLNNTPVGNVTRSTGAFTTLTSSSTTTLGATTATSINNTPVGNSTRSTGAFTTLASNSTTTLGATTATSIDNTPIGATTASTGRFTTLNTTSTATIAGTFTASTTANITGQLNANGEAVFAKDPTFPSQTGFKNLLINGAMDIFQRSTGSAISILSGNTSYITDRWYVQNGGGGVSITANQAAAPSVNFYNVLSVTGAVGNTSTIIGQRIESYNSTALSGKPVMVSFYVRRNSGNAITVALYEASAQDNWTSSTLIQSTSISPATGTLTQYVLYFNALPTTSYRGVSLVFDCGAHGSDTVIITGVQLEVCNSTNAAPQFEYRPYEYEVTLCRRYCRLLSDVQNSGGYATSTSALAVRYIFENDMRVAPSTTLLNNGTFYVMKDDVGQVNTTTTTVTSSSRTTRSAWYALSGFGGGLTSGHFYTAGTTNGTARFLLSAEL